MNTYLWRPNKGKISNTNLYLYSQFVKDNFQFDAKNDFNKLWKWSVKNPNFLEINLGFYKCKRKYRQFFT